MTSTPRLIPTTIPGLAVRPGLTEVVHVPSAQVLLRLPAGLDRATITGFDHGAPLYHPLRNPGALFMLGVLDWQVGELTPEHHRALARLRLPGETVLDVAAVQGRTQRVCAGLKRLEEFLRGPRGPLIAQARRAVTWAQEARGAAQTPAQKGAATRQEALARRALEDAGISAEGLRRLYGQGTRAAQLFRGAQTISDERARLDKARAGRVAAGQDLARAFLRERAIRPGSVQAELRLCLMMQPGAGMSLWAAYCAAGAAHHPLRDAGRERRRRRAQGLPLDPGAPDVRAATRPTRLALGRRRLAAKTSAPTKTFDELRGVFSQALGFKGAAVRARHLDAAMARLTAAFPEPTRRAAVYRGLCRMLNTQGQPLPLLGAA